MRQAPRATRAFFHKYTKLPHPVIGIVGKPKTSAFITVTCVDDTVAGVYTVIVKVVGNRIAETPAEYLWQGARLYESLERWNPYPRPRGKVFKFRTWEDLEKWRQSQTNPRLR